MNVSSSARGTTWLTMPDSCSSDALTKSIFHSSSLVRRGPRSHGTEKYWKWAGRKRASSLATTRSMAEAIIQPP